MENNQVNMGYLVVGAIVAIIIAYYVGASSGKTEAPAQEHTDIEYAEMKDCYKSVKSTESEVYDKLYSFALNGANPSYDLLKTTVSDISDIIINGRSKYNKPANCE